MIILQRWWACWLTTGSTHSKYSSELDAMDKVVDIIACESSVLWYDGVECNNIVACSWNTTWRVVE